MKVISNVGVKTVLTIIICCMFLYSLIPTAVVGFKFPVIINIGVCISLIYLLFCENFNIFKKIVTVGICVFGLIYIIFSGLFLYYSNKQPAQTPQTVIVLGCKINGGEPSLMLARRLDSAIKYVNENENTFIIVSGGQGSDEIMPEALAMKNYLTKNGIDENIIFVEDKSTSTFENINFSKKIIDENNLPNDVAIATDDFHQMRGQVFAQKCGLSSSSAGSCNTPWYMLSYYWTREMFACVQLIL